MNSFGQFSYQRIVAENTGIKNDWNFLVTAMLTEDYAHHGRRLAASCDKFRIPHIIFEIPSVHRSISPKGSNDLTFTKASFINWLLEEYQRPVLYLDSDCYFTEHPAAINRLVEDNIDFSIYNWLADEHTEAYIPWPVKIMSGNQMQLVRDRFYRFSHSVDYYSTRQLLCSGAVQFYNNTESARSLLSAWQSVTNRFPYSADDECMDYTFNVFIENTESIKSRWLDKSYARYAWWIYSQPVINHPDIATTSTLFSPIMDEQGRKRFYPGRTTLKKVDYFFPRDCLIDTKDKMLLSLENGQLKPIRHFTDEIWL